MSAECRPCFLANKPIRTGDVLEVRDKFSGRVFDRVARAGADHVDEAIARAVEAAPAMAALSSGDRAAVLEHCARRFDERREELALALCGEAGKPIKDSRGEVGRLIDTFRMAAGEALRIYGEFIPLDINANARGRLGVTRRFPLGPCGFITPFNFPLNLAAHKVAPALAVGCPFVLKPASATPLGALIIGEVLAETDLPPGAFSILPCSARDAGALVEDERLRLLSFTGSAEVGWDMKGRAGRKKVVLELGGNAACIVDETADLDDAVARIVIGAYYQSGQSCISVQRILAQRSVYDGLRDRLADKVAALVHGDPRNEDTFIGPMIDEGEAKRLEGWLASARARGARVLCGGRRDGAMLEAALVEGVPHDEPLWTGEAFGPVALIEPYDDFEDALRLANDSLYGLQAGVFTHDLERAMRAWEILDVGGVVVGDVPSWRVDHMPYGGVKMSGFGREGIRYSMETMTELRLMVIRRA